MSKAQNDNRLPVIQFDGGEYNDRLVQGVILKCTDGRWKTHDGTPLPEGMQFYVFGVTKGLQRWEDERVVEEIKKKPGQPLPDVGELNAKIPQDQWGEGIDGKPRPPWQLNDVIYLLALKDAMKFTFINCTVGAKIAAARLLDRIQSMQMLRGPNVIPIVELDSRPMKTSFGQKMRPDFRIISWRDFGSPTPAGLPPSTPQIADPVDPTQIGKPVEVTTEKLLIDAIPHLAR
jgi:hypothetical protein